MGKVATSPLPSGGSPRPESERWPKSGQGGYINPAAWGSPRLESGGHNHKWPTSGQGGYITLAAWGVPTASEWGAESEVAQKSARWLHNPCHLVVSQSLQSGGQNQKWPTSGQGGYITPAAWGVADASGQGAESEVAHKWARWRHNPCLLGGPAASKRGAESGVVHKWARWLHNPCRLRGRHRFKAGDRIRIGPQVGKLAT